MLRTPFAPAAKDELPLRFALAGLCNQIGSIVTNPMDLTKVRLQLDGELSAASRGERYYRNLGHCIRRIVAEEGFFGLYRGLPASLLREGSYSTIRLGAYEPFKELFGATDRHHTPLWVKVAAGACSGAIGSALANPTDIVKIRMQGQGIPGQPLRYKGTLDAFVQIAKTEGIRNGLYRGSAATIQRAAILTATQVPSYDHIKHLFLNHGWLDEGPVLHGVASMLAGFNTAFITSPIDCIKTRIMNQKTAADGSLQYSGILDCARQTMKSEGIAGFYKGFLANWMRLGPHTIVTFFVYEFFRNAVGLAPV